MNMDFNMVFLELNRTSKQNKFSVEAIGNVSWNRNTMFW